MHGVPLSPMREEEEVEDESSIIVGAHPVVGDVDPDGKVFDDPEPVPARGPVKVQPLFVRRGRTVPQQV
ncbi:hypothetical protein ONZ51_g11283 [Trametes cubensis]|uniref:Uncharacterized protein n=1 Tax=Trametes cubensis TaxID=1111947 RepID=A0AAD7X5K1_9APHY|nr:hypothetical protein ONZ51_g11283 [Trametes cubensis]